MKPTRTPGRQRGTTLVEAATVTAIVAVVAGLAVPSFEQTRQRRHLEGVAAQLETDLHLARAIAVARNQVVRASFSADEAASCYVLHTGPSGSCDCMEGGQAACKPGAVSFKTVRLQSQRLPRLLSNSKSVAFDPTAGTATPTTTIRIRLDDGSAIHQIVNVMGRVRSCTPAPGIAGYPVC